MSNEIKRGRGYLHDRTPAQGVYEVDYVVNVNTQMIKNVGLDAVPRKVVTANVQSVNGYIIKNGKYDLEKNGEIIFQLEKTGTSWCMIS